MKNPNNERVWDNFFLDLGHWRDKNYACYDLRSKSGINIKGHRSTHALSNEKALFPRKFLLTALTEEN
jgi:hypothetical protein